LALPVALPPCCLEWVIAWIQTWAYGTPDVNRLHSFAENLDWYWVVLIPTIGGVATV
jgi:CIC family chloride channel protein